MRLPLAILALSVGVLLGGCQTSKLFSGGDAPQASAVQARPASKGIPTVVNNLRGDLELGSLSLERRQELGARLADRVLKRLRRSANKPLEDALTAIAARLASASSHTRFHYKVYLIDDPAANAFTTGGGHRFVTTGLVRILKSEAQMAMVIAHEMAHNVEAHVLKGERTRAAAKDTTHFTKSVLEDRLGLPWLSNGIGLLVNARLKKYTRSQEKEADLQGLRYLVAAGYDPWEAPRTFENLMKAHRDRPELLNFFFGDHPTSTMRVWRLKNQLNSTYAHIDPRKAVRSTASYDRLARRYWVASAAEHNIMPLVEEPTLAPTAGAPH